MKVGEQAVYLARLKGLNRNEAIKQLKSWFEKFEIEEWWDKKVEELSKGMAQKYSLSRQSSINRKCLFSTNRSADLTRST